MLNATREFVDDAFRRGGNSAVIRLWPRLFTDLGSALLLEYRDHFCETDTVPERFVIACLGVAAVVWTLILGASALEWRWAAILLDASLAATMLLAFGLPAAALAASRMRLAMANTCRSAVAFLWLSGVATIGTWSLLACHVAAYA